MRVYLLLFLVMLTFVGRASGQGNTVAGLAGVGAGAALSSAAGQGGTTPSSAGGTAAGGGTAPIEIQIMVFQGMKVIASEIADLTASYAPTCKKAVERDNACSILIEDPTSSNQIALYQALQGYYAHLRQIDEDLQPFFSLQIKTSLSFDYAPGDFVPPMDSVTITNVSKTARQVKEVIVTGSAAFEVDVAGCDMKLLQSNSPCSMAVLFPRNGVTVDPGKTYTATVRIFSGDPGSDKTDTVQLVQLVGTVQGNAQTSTAPNKPGKGRPSVDQSPSAIPPAETATSGGSTSSSGGSSSSSSTPTGLTYLSDLTTALGALKSNITYGPAAAQPPPQSFQVLVEAELKERGLFPYTSTSTLNLKPATEKLTSQFGELLAWNSDIAAWGNQCKPPTTTPGGGAQTNSISNSACTLPLVIDNLAIGSQLATGYTSLLTSPNDGSGTPVIVDILRGQILSTRIAESSLSLQLAIAAAGGNTKTNSIFGVNLFYTFAPSYNAGVIATFELRDKENLLLASGARNALFAYGKWKSKPFDPKKMKEQRICGSFCSTESHNNPSN
jgi:hypothetical protein